MKDAAEAVIATLSEAERRRSAAYLNPDPLEKGAEVAVRGVSLAARARSYLAFVDLQPDANWGHPCRYLLVAVEDGSVTSSDGQFPPGGESLRLIHRGEKVEDWTLLSDRPLEEE